MQIAFIGLGNMGAPMAQNLAAAGYAVRGYDVDTATAIGVTSCPSLEAALQDADVVITMLPNGAILKEVIGQAIKLSQSPRLFIDCSTVDVASARTVATDLQEKDHLAVDAPVSGGTGGAQSGTLTFMAGGTEDAIAQTKPLFDVMGAKLFHCGPNGSGQAAKICNNMILGISMIATCEAFALADGLGLDRQALFDVVAASSGQSWSMTTYCPAPGVGPTTPADNNYEPGFAADLMLKDLTLAQQAAGESNTHTVMGEQARALYQAFVDADGAGKDFSAILTEFQNKDHA